MNEGQASGRADPRAEKGDLINLAFLRPPKETPWNRPKVANLSPPSAAYRIESHLAVCSTVRG